MAFGTALLMGWWAMAGVAWGCDPELLTLTRNDLSTAKNADYKIRKLAGSLGESCTFAKGLGSAIASVPSIEIGSRPALEQKVVTGDPAAWAAACPGGAATFDAAFAQKGAERAHTLFTGCDVGRFRFATEPELGQATGFPFLSVLVARHFEDQKVADALALPLLRALAGIEGPPPAAGAVVSAAVDPWVAAADRLKLVVGKPVAAFPAAEWATHATALLSSCEALRARPAAERLKGKQVEFDACGEAGRAADNAGAQTAPLFRPLNGTNANWGYYLAGALAKGDPTLVPGSKDETIKSRVGWYAQQIVGGVLPQP